MLAMCTGRRLWICVAQPCKLPWLGRPGNQTQYKSGLCRHGRAHVPTASSAPMQASLPSAGMQDFRIRLRHPRSVPCFPWCVLWERRGTAIYTAGRILGWLPGLTSRPCQLCPRSSGALPVQCHLPGKVAWGILGAEIKERDVCEGWGPPLSLSTRLS